MKDDSRDIIKNLFQDKFEGFEPNPPGWNEFEPKLKRHQFIKSLKQYGIGITIVATIIATVMYISPHKEVKQKLSKIDTTTIVKKVQDQSKNNKEQKEKEVKITNTTTLKTQVTQKPKKTTTSVAPENNNTNNKNLTITDSTSTGNTENPNPTTTKTVEPIRNSFSLELLSDAIQCAPANIELRVNKENTKSILLFIGDKKIDASGSENIKTTIQNPGKIIVHAFVTFNDGTTKTYKSDFSLNILPKPHVEIKETDNSLMVIKSKKTDNITWNIDGKTYTNITKFDLTMLEYGTHNISIIESNNYCADTAYKTITLKEHITDHMPNAFTPNNDGKNDIFKPVFNIKPDTYKFIIYDKFGKVIFVSTDPDKGWDGKNAKPGLYVWKLMYKDTDGKMIEKNGNVTLIKN